MPEEGFLAGLALNNENVTFKDPYKKILRFYGFDLENEQLPALKPETNSTLNETATATSTMSPLGSSDSATMTVAMTAENKPVPENSSTPPTREETTSTTNPNAETLNPVDIRGPTSVTASPSSAPNAESTPMSSTITTTEKNNNIITETTTQTVMTTTQILETTTQAPTSSTTKPTITPTDGQSTAADAEIITPSSQVTNTLTNEPTTNNEVDTSTLDSSTVQTTTLQMTSNSDQSTSLDASTSQSTLLDMTPTTETTVDSSTITSTITTENPATDSVMTTMPETQQTEQMSTITMSDMTTASNSVTPANESTLETLERKKKSIVDFIFTNPPYINDYLFYRSYDIGSDTPNPNFDDKMFLANGLRSVQVRVLEEFNKLSFIVDRVDKMVFYWHVAVNFNLHDELLFLGYEERLSTVSNQKNARTTIPTG